jgi:hypothetical protein
MNVRIYAILLWATLLQSCFHPVFAIADKSVNDNEAHSAAKFSPNSPGPTSKSLQ